MLPQPPLWLVLVAFVCALGPLVFFHELGHYLVARLFRIPAETFSIGFGREIRRLDRQAGHAVESRVAAARRLCKIRRRHDARRATPPSSKASREHLRDHAFQLRPVWQRFLVVLAGPVANFLLAIIIFAAFFMTLGAPRTNWSVRSCRRLPAAAAGLSPGTRFYRVAGRETPEL